MDEIETKRMCCATLYRMYILTGRERKKKKRKGKEGGRGWEKALASEGMIEKGN